MEMDYGTDNLNEEVQKKKKEDKTASNKPKAESKLTSKLQDLIRLIFDMKMMEKVMAEMEYDVKKNPLGKLKKDQIMRGYKVLSEIEAEMNGKNRISVLSDLSSNFYTLIPHSFPRSHVPPVIRTQEMLKKKVAMCEALGNIEIAASIISAEDDSDTPELDQNYERLNTDITVVDPSSDEFTNIQKYVNNSHPYNAPKIATIYKLDRKGEAERFKDKSVIGNRRLLWHGSRLTNFVGIVSQGLRIAPPEAPCSGYRFGKGIYFADMAQLSANYCRAYGQKEFLMLLCDVALGDMAEFHKDKYVEKAPEGKHSVFALGRIQPDPAEFTTMYYIFG
jgi:poly [ADP-ribose] polymerase